LWLGRQAGTPVQIVKFLGQIVIVKLTDTIKNVSLNFRCRYITFEELKKYKRAGSGGGGGDWFWVLWLHFS
jgi:hypothetical protein